MDVSSKKGLARLGVLKLREKEDRLAILYLPIAVTKSTGNASVVNRTEQLQDTCEVGV